MTLKGSVGFGSEVSGEVVVLQPKRGVVPSDLDFSLEGKIVVFPGWVPAEVLQKATLIGVLGVVVSQIHHRDFEHLKNQAEYSLLVLDKFGKMDYSDYPADLIRKLEKFDGKKGKLIPEEKTLEVD